MSRYRILETDEAIKDVTNMAIYIYEEFCNKDAAEHLIELYSEKVLKLEYFPTGYRGISIEHRGYEIHVFPFKSYNIFFVIREQEREVIVLRVLHQLQNWISILNDDDRYHIGGGVF